MELPNTFMKNFTQTFEDVRKQKWHRKPTCKKIAKNQYKIFIQEFIKHACFTGRQKIAYN